MKLWNRLLIVLIVLVAIPFYWLLIDARTSAIPMRPIDVDRLRQVAQELPGQKPVAIEYAPVAARRVIGAALVSGGGLKPELVGVTAFRLVTPGGDTVIDSGLDKAQADTLGADFWNAAAQARVESWMEGARLILFTHEHLDHVGGYLASPRFDAIGAKAVLRPEMIPALKELAPARAAALPPPLSYGDYAAVAPGVVLLRTPGHTPGSQMIYVQLQNGREYLFTGDTASMVRNVTWQRPRSHLLADWVQPEDRAATTGWIKGLADAVRRQPHLTLVYGHDLAWLQSPRRGPGFHTDFTFRTTAEDRSPEDDDASGNPL